MDCREAREGLWPPERPRLMEGDVARAKAHVDTCPECIAYFEQDRALLEAYDRARRERAPAELRERVFDALAMSRWTSERERDLSGKARRYLIAGVLAVAGLVAVLALPGGDAPVAVERPGDNAAGIFAEDFLRRAVAQDHIVTSDPNDVQRFLQRELGMHVAPLRLAGLDLERAEICLIEGRRGALIVYKRDGRAISHYLVPRSGAQAQAPTVVDFRDGPSGAPMPVVIWSSPEVEQALVGEVAAEELLRIADGGIT